MPALYIVCPVLYCLGMAYNKEVAKRWRERNKELLAQRNKEYRKKNREMDLARKVRYRELNREKVAIYDRAYRQSHKEERTKWTTEYQSLRRMAIGSHTEEEWEELKAKYNYQCLSCRKFHPEIKLSKDHVIPFRQSGTNYISNIQPLCVNCNSKKKTKSTDFRLNFQNT